MLVEELLLDRLGLPGDTPLDKWVPADNLSRQAWQEVVEAMIRDIRNTASGIGFALTAPEISIHYHQPLADFVSLVASRMR